MPPTTARLKLPYILQSQSQKEVTHNEALNILDILLHATVQSLGLNTPLAAPTLGDCWIIGPYPTGIWANKPNHIAQAIEGGWWFVPPIKRLRLWNEATESYVQYNGTSWVQEGMLLKDSGEYVRIESKTEEVSLSGAFKDTTMLIPERAIMLAVHTRVVMPITGATSFSIGVAGEVTKFGNLLGISLDATNIGVISPTAYYANTPLRVTANGGNFTGGVVRLTLQYMNLHGPWAWE